MVVFGGKADKCLNDVHFYHFVEKKWETIPGSSAFVAGRYAHGAAMWEEAGKMVVYGGYDSDGTVSNELLFFDLGTASLLCSITTHPLRLYAYREQVMGGCVCARRDA